MVLAENRNLKGKEKFLELLSDKINQISIYPESCPKSEIFDNIYKCVLNKQLQLIIKNENEKKSKNHSNFYLNNFVIDSFL